YLLVPRVILFRLEHTPRVLVPEVDFVSAPGSSPPNVYRLGGPYALVTGRCVFTFDRQHRLFRLTSIHAGHTMEEIHEQTGFAFEVASGVGQTPAPDKDTLALIRGPIGEAIGNTYPAFGEEILDVPVHRRV
ncbi:MAG: CoA synthetase, partial [Acidiferrobacterales bacterium]